MPLIRLALTARRHPRVWRLLAGIVVMALLFATLLSAVEPAHGQACAAASVVGASNRGRPPLRPGPTVPAPDSRPACGAA